MPSLGREDPLEEEMANPLQYPCLGNPTDKGAWWATVHGVPKSQTGTTYDQDKWQRRCPNSGFLLTRDW